MSGSTQGANETASSAAREPDKDYVRWQKKLLPFMTRMVAALTFFFFLASFGQLIYLHWNIRTTPNLNLSDPLQSLSASELTPQQTIEASRLKALIMLEGHSLERQYHQANVLLMARVWTSYLGFVTGMVLSLVGAAFILGKMRETISEFSATVNENPVSLKSASPGLLLAVLGTMLMVATIVTHHNIEVVDRAVYLTDSSGTTSADKPALSRTNPLTQESEVPASEQPSSRAFQKVETSTSVAAQESSTKPPLHRPPVTENKPVAAPAQQPSLAPPTPNPAVTP